MSQRRPRQRSSSSSSSSYSSPNSHPEWESKPQREPAKRSSHQRQDSRTSHSEAALCADLATLIEQDAPLKSHTGLVLMYGPFQAEMQAEQGQGVASWLRDCVRKHGLPSLVRLDYRRRAQVLRRDQFQPLLEPLMARISG